MLAIIQIKVRFNDKQKLFGTAFGRKGRHAMKAIQKNKKKWESVKLFWKRKRKVQPI